MWIGRAGVVTLPQVAALFWGPLPSARVAAARRLRLLADHGLVEVGVTELAAPNRLVLSERGADLVGGPALGGRVLRPGLRPTSRQADHFIACAEAWSALARRLSRGDGPRLLRFVTEGEVRKGLRERTDALIPDGIALVGHGPAPAVALALEIDLGHESHRVFLKKLAKYAPHLATRRALYGVVLDALLVVAPGARRLSTVARALLGTPLERGTFFQDLAKLGPDRVLENLGSVRGAAAGAEDAFRESLVAQSRLAATCRTCQEKNDPCGA